MRPRPTLAAVLLATVLSAAGLLAGPAALAAQDSTITTIDSQAAPVEAPKKKKKGLLGKLKSIAQDKTVQSVAKVAACTMVPGGQYVAGAIDAASSASEGNASGAASGAAGAASGSSCYGGMGAGAAAAAGPAGLGTTAASVGVDVAATAAASAMSSRFGDAQPGAAPGPGTQGGEFVMTEKQEKAWIKQMKKAGLTEEQARQQLEVYKQQMAAASAPDEN